MKPRAEQHARADGRISGFRRAAYGLVALLLLLGIGASIGAGPAAARPQAQDTLTPKQKSEIRRGYAVANACHRGQSAHDPESFDDCLRKAIGKETHNPYVYYVMLGLEFGCWRLSDISEGRYALVYYFEYRSYQAHLGVTDEQVLKATRTHDAQTRARLAYWAKHRPASPVEIRPVPQNRRQAQR